MAIFISHSPEETLALGESWGRNARAGWVIGLSGELGSGKTQLAKGIARGLGVAEPVLSPTFALVHEYHGRLPLAHLDLYRLENLQQIEGAGLAEYLFAPSGVTVVEWLERCPELSSQHASLCLRQVRLETVDECTRRISYEDSGA
jgi:tRNA threonylcarbamoyladenosine biosynthesis protein TsaE